MPFVRRETLKPSVGNDGMCRLKNETISLDPHSSNGGVADTLDPLAIAPRKHRRCAQSQPAVSTPSLVVNIVMKAVDQMPLRHAVECQAVY